MDAETLKISGKELVKVIKFIVHTTRKVKDELKAEGIDLEDSLLLNITYGVVLDRLNSLEESELKPKREIRR